MCLAWGGHVSAAVYVDDDELPLLIKALDTSELQTRNRRVRVHVVLKRRMCVSLYSRLMIDSDRRRFGYPVNHLRNVALEHARTSRVLLLDVDFLPMAQLHDKVLQAMADMKITEVKS